MTDGLTARFEALHAERVRTWNPAKLAANIAQRQALVEAFDPGRIVAVGDRVTPFTLRLAGGGTVDLDTLTAQGPVALIFFRFAGCPACNIALPYYDSTLAPELRRLGIKTVAISPHLVERGLGAIADRHALSLTVAEDRGNALARRFGLTFEPADAGPPPADDNWIGALTGTGTWELPQPAIILIDGDHVVRFVDVSPDWLKRTEAETVIAAAGALARPKNPVEA